jgi:acylphosphatase
MVTRQIRVKGHVQGVGFRHAMRREALRLGVRGWVRNRRDGSVEALLRGDADAVARALAWARRGPPAASVDAVQETPPDAAFDREYETFEEWPTA